MSTDFSHSTAAWDDRAMKLSSDAMEHVAATLRIAAALAGSGRSLDLAGLDSDVGKLCAGLLDLPPDMGRILRPRLLGLVAELDRLADVMGSPRLATGSRK